MEEAWKDVVGYENRLAVSTLGRVYAKKRKKFIDFQDHKGYNGFTLTISKGNRVKLMAHRLVAEAFLPPPSKPLTEECSRSFYGSVLVRHGDDNRKNNAVSNLSWGTYADNTQDAVTRQRMNPPKGVEHWLSKFSREDICHIREVFKRGCHTNGVSGLARQYNVSACIISKIVRGLSYR